MRKINKKLFSGLIISLFVTSVLAPVLVQAQSPTGASRPTPTPTAAPRGSTPTTGINLTVSPSFLNLTTDPGKSLESEFRITNNSNFSETLTVTVAKFMIDSEGKPTLSDVTPDDAFADWVTFSENQFTIASNQTKTVSFTVSPPETASLGYYYAFVISRVDQTSGTTQGAAISGSPALLTLLEVRSENTKREVQVLDFSTDKLWYEYLPTEFKIQVKNSGNVHIVPTGNIFIDQGGKKDIAILAVNESRGNVLPATEREYTSSWSDGFAVRVPKEENGSLIRNENGEIVYTTKYDFQKADKFRIGKYTANLLLVYNNGERDVPIEASVSFWVIPWKIIGVVTIILLFMLLGVRSTIVSNIRRFKKK